MQKPKISIVLPCRNEEESLPVLVPKLRQVMSVYGLNDFEIVIVDHLCTDNTNQVARDLGIIPIKCFGPSLGHALLTGISGASGNIVLVMDADGQHPPEAVPRLLKPILEEGTDMTIGSRYVEGGSSPEWKFSRKLISKIACVIGYSATGLKDATSGMFAFKKELINQVNLNPTSWKIMLEVLFKANPTKVVEVPIQFGSRETGVSKFNTRQAMLYLKHLLLLTYYKHRATIKRATKFGLIGLSGMAIHFPLLYVLTDVAGLWYIGSAIIAVVATATINYTLNHRFTFRDRGIESHAVGWTKYQVLSAITDAMYIGLLAMLVEITGMWYILGSVVSLVILFPLKFSVASKFIWRERKDADAADHDWKSFYQGGSLQKKWKRAIAETIWNWIPVSGNLLNIGCGSSPIATKYSNSINIDTNKAKLTFLKEKLPNITVVNSSAEELPFGNGQFEEIVCAEMIEHSSNPEKVVSEIARVLKPRGNAVITTPDYSKLFWRISKGFIGCEEDHVSHFTRETLERLCRKHGLMPTKCKYVASCDLCEMFKKEAS